MSRSTFARHLPPCLVLCSLFVLSSPPAHAQREAATADARLRALYTEEWNWRQQELRGRRQRATRAIAFPRVDAASQQARLAYWTRTLATLDTIPVRPALTRREDQRADLPHLPPRARQRRAVPHLRSAVQQRHVLLDRLHAASGLRHRRRVSRVSRAAARCAALLRRTDRQHARRPGAWLHRAARVGARARSDHRAIRERRRQQSVVRAVHADARRPSPRADQDALRAEAATVIRDIVAPAYARLLDDDSRRVSGQGAHDARRQGDARRGGVLPGDDREAHDADADAAADSRHRPEGSRPHRGRDARDQGARRTSQGRWPSSSRSCRTDPQFYAKTPRELLSYSAYVAKKADGKLAETIGFLPRRRHGIRPVPDALAPIYTGRTRRPRGVPDEHLQPAGAPALHARRRSRCTSARRGTASRRRSRSKGPERPAVPPRHVVLRIRRRLGSLHGMARHRRWGSTRRRTRTSAG